MTSSACQASEGRDKELVRAGALHSIRFEKMTVVFEQPPST